MKCMSNVVPIPRKPKGTPVGGEFAKRDRSESAIGLVDIGAGGVTAEEQQRRALALEHGGFIPAIAGPRLRDRGARAWWSAAFVRAEHQPHGQGFYKMGDLWTAKGMQRSRRLGRYSYDIGGVQLKMPSITQIKKASADRGHETFDVPISASFPGGSVDGWVRVTRNGPGEWSVQGLNMDPKAAAYAAEAVSALLEARKVSTAAVENPDLMARRQARFARGGIKMQETKNSAFITGVGYNHAAHTMAVKIGNRHYSYRVPPETYKKVLSARNPGAAYNLLVKGNERSVPVSSCDNCHRFYAENDGHRCPSQHRDLTPGVKPGGVESRDRARAASLPSLPNTARVTPLNR